jgi:hypothetical protein
MFQGEQVGAVCSHIQVRQVLMVRQPLMVSQPLRVCQPLVRFLTAKFLRQSLRVHKPLMVRQPLRVHQPLMLCQPLVVRFLTAKFLTQRTLEPINIRALDIILTRASPFLMDLFPPKSGEGFWIFTGATVS